MTDVLYDGKARQFIVGGFTVFGSFLSIYSGETFRETSRMDFLLDYGYGLITLDEKGRRVYQVSLVQGNVYVLDLDRRTVIQRQFVQRGLRSVAYDPVRGLLHVGGYTRGNLFVLELR